MRLANSSALGTLFVLAVSVAAVNPGVAHAAQPVWNGQYTFFTYASQKSGTSPASRQYESDFNANFTLATSCISGMCVATVTQGPAPSNPTIPQPMRYTWNGTQWVATYDWVWNCYQGDGPHKLWSPATSWAFYEPQPDGSLKGTWYTDIDSGPCRGSVMMPVTATPIPQ
jgi:hypothetical protein